MSLQGTIETFAIADVLRLLAATNKSGRLQVQGPDRSGTVWVDGGKVLAAESPSTPHADQVPDVLFQLVRFDRGSFSFELNRHPPQPGEPVDIEAALGEAESMVSEWREIERRVPSAQAWVGLRSELPNQTVTVTAEQWKVVRAVGGGRSVAGIGDALGLGELPALRAVDQLLGLGLVEVGGEPGDTAADGAAAGAEGASSGWDGGLGSGRGVGSGPGVGSGAGLSGGSTLVGDSATVSAPSPSPTVADQGERSATGWLSESDRPSTPVSPPAPPEAVATANGPTNLEPAPSRLDEAGADRLAGAASGAFPTAPHDGASPHGDPLAGEVVDVSAESTRANPPPPPGYDYGGGYGQATYSEYDQAAYSAFGEYGQQAQPGYGEYGQPPVGGYGTPPPPPAPYGEYYGDSGRSDSPPPPYVPGAESWAPPTPPVPPAPLAPDWTTTGRNREQEEAGGRGAEAGGTGWPGEDVARARTIFESTAPPPPPPPPPPGGSISGTSTQWFDGSPERLAPPPPPPPPVLGREQGNGADGDVKAQPSDGGSSASGQAGADDASSLERQLQHLSPKAQEAIKRSSGLFEGRSPR